jgi:glycosyltransferase involved in cell wall biosynthesis
MTPSQPHPLPLVSIVTPSYNMAQYLPDTLDSVLSQDYPNIEYIVMDGGSSDGTLDILERYQGRLRYVSAPDKGAADAINQGFALAHGEIIGWLNADDTYLPGAIKTAVHRLLEEPDVTAVYGHAYWVDEKGAILKPYPTRSFTPEMLADDCYICQPACFMRRASFEKAGGLDVSLQSSFDYDLWARLARGGGLATVPDYLATSRMHSENKTLSDRSRVFREGFLILRRYYGYIPFHWIHSYISYRRDKRDQYYEPLQPTILNYLLSLPIGLAYNWRHGLRYFGEWLGVINYAAAIRSWQRSWLGRMLQRSRRP